MSQFSKIWFGRINRRHSEHLGEYRTFDKLLETNTSISLLALAPPSPPSYNTPPCEAPMPITIRPYRRFPVQCIVTYNHAPERNGSSALCRFFGASRLMTWLNR